MEKVSVFLLLVGVLQFLSKNSSFGIEINKCSTLFHKVKGKALTGHIISVHQIRNELDCGHKCLSNPKCVSFNFEIQQSRSLSTCELNNLSRMPSDNNLQIRDGFAYYEPLTPRERPKQEITAITPETSNLITATATTQEVSPTQAEATIPPTSVPSATQPPTTTAAPGSNCGQHWHAYKSGCLRLFQDHKGWVAAKDHCANFRTPGRGNGRLIAIFSQDENNLIVNLWSSLKLPQGDYFIGLNDRQTEGTYMWVQGPVATSLLNWLRSFLGNAESDKDCVVISLNSNSDNGKWKTNECNHNLRFICECPDGPCV
ncbi:PREDICTED: C-type lectin domain family 4 member E-like isoform X2 [Acropora digitifera]|uniref:C-type lectin domain family 4 member E-like isoform X2 n=1 Tax=Acropora digitifera TaxID=70779 RepID=UPI00077A9EFA|nr:PREDICTED: C-type lectin domain family 4 member E-like isoform X2 [Acropora digitifera]